MESIISPEKPLVCPFRTLTKLIPNQFGAADQMIEFPECHGNACPFYDSNAVTNSDKCLRAVVEIV
jgi:hypothetical protein